MGKGQIISSDGEGLYTIKVIYNRDYYDRQKERLLANIAALEAELITVFDHFERKLIELKITSCEKELASLDTLSPSDPTTQAWCADKTDDLSGIIGTLEIPGESTNIQIQPGFSSGHAAWVKDRDGQLVHASMMPASGTYYNLAMLPGWQKWKPLLRYATIDSIDKSESTALITLYPDTSSQQGLDINQSTTIEGVPIEYMSCDGQAFSEHDDVLVKFEDQDWTKPKIIGFKDHPKGCGSHVMISIDWICVIWDVTTGEPAELTYNDGSPVLLGDWPIDKRDITTWLESYQKEGDDLFADEYCQSQTPNDGVNSNCFARTDCFFLEIPSPPLAYGATDSYSIDEEVVTVVNCPDASGDKADDNILIWHQEESHDWVPYDPPRIYPPLGNYENITKKTNATLEYSMSGLGKIYTPIINDAVEPKSIQVSIKGVIDFDYFNRYFDTSGKFVNQRNTSEMVGIKSPFGDLMDDTNYVTQEYIYRFNDPGIPGETFNLNEDTRWNQQQLSGSMNTEVWAKMTGTVMVQMWYSAGLALEKTDFHSINNYYNGWKWIAGDPTVTYETLKERTLYATIAMHDDTAVINPFNEDRDSDFEDYVLLLIDKAKENEDSAWHYPGTYHPKMPFTPGDLEIEILE